MSREELIELLEILNFAKESDFTINGEVFHRFIKAYKRGILIVRVYNEQADITLHDKILGKLDTDYMSFREACIKVQVFHQKEEEL